VVERRRSLALMQARCGGAQNLKSNMSFPLENAIA
jgi:hypothetical protein